MANLKNSIGNRGSRKKVAPATAPAAPATAPVPAEAPAPAKKSGTKKRADQIVKEFADQAPEVAEGVARGSLSDKLAYVTALGDPSEIDRATLKGADGKEETRVFSRIIGYRFKALVDMSIPDFGTTDRFNGNRLNNAADLNKWTTVSAGEEFDLTRVETGALLSQPEFNMVATGGEHDVRLQVSFGRVKSTELTDAESLPSMSLVVDSKDVQSIKDLGIIDVLDYEPETGQQFAQGKRTLRPEFEGTKFATRALDRSSKRMPRRGTSSARTKEQQLAEMSRAMQGMFSVLQKKQG